MLSEYGNTARRGRLHEAKKEKSESKGLTHKEHGEEQLVPINDNYFKALRPSNAGYQALEKTQFPPRKFPATLARYALVFEMDDDWRNAARNPSESNAQSIKLAFPLIDKLRSADMIVQEFYGKGLKEYFCLISITEKRQKMVAELMGSKIRLRLKRKDDQGDEIKRDGAWMVFKQHLAQLYERCTEGTLFSSCQQCQMIEFLLNDEDVRALGPQLIQKESCEPGNTPLMQLKKDERIKDFFYLHHPDKFQWLTQAWSDTYTKRQPLEDIREYFGESVALYFAWMGYWLTMLWVPALTGVVVFIMGILSFAIGGTFDSPFVPLFCIFISVWSIMAVTGWKRLEQTLMYQWETLNYEEPEQDRTEFVQSKRTYKRLNELLEKEEYYPDPMWRWVALVLTCIVLPILVGINVTLYVSVDLFEKSLAGSTGGPYGVMAYVGAILHAVIYVAFGYFFELIFLDSLTQFENWKTENEHRNAKAAKYSFFFQTTAHFSYFLWGFVWNHAKIDGMDLSCVDKICYDYLMIKVPLFCATIFLSKFLLRRFLAHSNNGQNSDLEEEIRPAENEEVEGQRPMDFEGEISKPKFTPWDLTSKYLAKMTEIAFVVLFSGTFPMLPFLALLVQIFEIRQHAKSVISEYQRPSYHCSRDIGTINDFIDIVITIGILTQCCTLAFASNGLAYYFPDLDQSDRILYAAVLEHLLLLFKIGWEGSMSSVPDEVNVAFEKKKYEQKVILEELEVFDPANDVIFYTSDDGEAFYGQKK